MGGIEHSTRIILYPAKGQTSEIVYYFNRNLAKNAFPLIATNTEFTSADADFWYEMQRKSKHIRAITINEVGDIIGAGYLNRAVGRKAHTAKISVTVDSLCRNQGVATLLFKSLIKEAKKLGITRIEDEPVESNTPAIHILEKLGFEREGIAIRKMRLDNGTFANCIYMALILDREI